MLFENGGKVVQPVKTSFELNWRVKDGDMIGNDLHRRLRFRKRSRGQRNPANGPFVTAEAVRISSDAKHRPTGTRAILDINRVRNGARKFMCLSTHACPWEDTVSNFNTFPDI